LGLLDPVFQSNDDVVLQLLLRGGLHPSLPPTSQTLFLHVWLARPLAALCTGFPSFPWLDLLTVGGAVLAGLFTGGLAVFWVQRTGARLVVASVAVLALLPFVARPQWTMTAALLAAPLLLWSLGRALSLGRCTGRGWGITAAVFCLAGLLLRSQAALLMLGLGALLVAVAVWSRPNVCESAPPKPVSRLAAVQDALRPTWPLLVAVLFGVGLGWVHEREHSQTPGWQTSIEYNRLRFAVVESTRGCGSLGRDVQTADGPGWTPQDYAFVKAWLYDGGPRSSLPVLRQAEASLSMGWGHAGLAAQVEDFANQLRLLKKRLTREPWGPYPGLLLALLAVLVARGRARHVAAVAAGGLVLLVVAFGIAWLGKLPPHRVMWPPLAVGTLVTATLVWRQDPPRWAVWRWVAAAAMLVAGFHATGRNLVLEKEYYDRVRADAMQDLALIDALPGDPPVVCVGGGAPFEHLVRPLRPTPLAGHRILSYGWLNATPHDAAVRAAEGMTEPLTDACRSGGRVPIWLARQDVDAVLVWIRAHAGRNAQLTDLRPPGGHSRLVTCTLP
jgi:hypothetical protein